MTSSTHPFEQEEVMAYLDGELSLNRATSVAAHLRECVECVELVQQMRGVSVHLTNCSVEPAPASLTKSLETARSAHTLAKENKPGGIAAWLDGRFAPLRSRRILGAASAVAVILLLLAIERPNLLRAPEAARTASPLAYTTQSRTVDTASSKSAPSESEALVAVPQAPEPTPAPAQPMIARTASISWIVKDFAPLEASVKAIAQRHNGYIAGLNSTSPQDAARSMSATLRIPSAQLKSAVVELKQLGRVEQESQAGEEVTKEFTDRAARLKNALATEQRLLEILRNHTGKVKDILETEQEIARVRGDIEQMEADQRALQTRVDFATVQLSVQEEYKASLQGAPSSTATRLHNAAVEGYRAAIESVIEIGVWSLQSLPTILFWGLTLFVPTRWMWKRWRRPAVLQS